jgi:EpsI family protein
MKFLALEVESHPVNWSEVSADLMKAEARQAYTGPAGTVGVHLAYYRGQTEDRKIVSSQNMLVGMRDPDWSLPVVGRRELSVDGKPIALRTAEILGRAPSGAGGRPHLVVWRLYWIDGRFIAGDEEAKIAGVLARLQGHGDEGAAIVLYADGETVDASNAALEAFVRANLQNLGALLQRTRDAR